MKQKVPYQTTRVHLARALEGYLWRRGWRGGGDCGHLQQLKKQLQHVAATVRSSSGEAGSPLFSAYPHLADMGGYMEHPRSLISFLSTKRHGITACFDCLTRSPQGAWP